MAWRKQYDMSSADAVVFNENNCVICLGEFSSCTKKARVVKTGIPNTIKYSEQLGDVTLQVSLLTQSKRNPRGKVLVHASCCRGYTDPKRTKLPLSKFLLFVCLFASFIISGSNYSTTWTFRFWKYFLMRTVVLIIHYIAIYFKIYCSVSCCK